MEKYVIELWDIHTIFSPPAFWTCLGENIKFIVLKIVILLSEGGWKSKSVKINFLTESHIPYDILAILPLFWKNVSCTCWMHLLLLSNSFLLSKCVKICFWSVSLNFRTCWLFYRFVPIKWTFCEGYTYILHLIFILCFCICFDGVLGWSTPFYTITKPFKCSFALFVVFYFYIDDEYNSQHLEHSYFGLQIVRCVSKCAITCSNMFYQVLPLSGSSLTFYAWQWEFFSN